jgi:A/G-specific adenine glycosylase
VKKSQPVSNLFSTSEQRRFRPRLLVWYGRHRRDLPWRENRDPYRVWLSEIMLQQTRVAAVVPHYNEFLRRFPTVEKLAAGRESSVLAAWSGLGYYRRARMLHAAAKVIVREHRGKFPATADQWRTLPGIGRYTAAAIASIAFGEPVAVVDGNVERVLQRVAGIRMAGEELWTAANELLDAKRPGDFNQAMMELGAVVCTPRAPACLTCPVIELCATRGELAMIAKPAPQRKRHFHYTLHLTDERVFLAQRSRKASLMAGMWELPEVADGQVPGGQQVPLDKIRAGSPDRLASRRKDKVKAAETGETNLRPLFTLRHSITITNYTVQVWPAATVPNALGKWIPVERLKSMALTGLARKILRKAAIF